MSGTLNFSLTEPGMSCSCCGENHVKLELLYALQAVRDILGQPISIFSAYRCEQHNANIGGEPTSSHIKGLAADIVIHNSIYSYSIMNAIMTSRRFTRIGFEEMDDKLVLHLDIDSSKIQNVLWGY